MNSSSTISAGFLPAFTIFRNHRTPRQLLLDVFPFTMLQRLRQSRLQPLFEAFTESRAAAPNVFRK